MSDTPQSFENPYASPEPPFAPPTRVRHTVVAVTALMAVLLYLDRYCISFAEVFIKEDLGLSADQVAMIMSAFFWTYALMQVPSGWLTDRFGARLMLTSYILLWSVFTGLTGAAIGIVSLLILRFGFGVGQAGAYPTGAAVISKWVPFRGRGAASGIVAVGGRIGGFLALFITGPIIVMLVPTTVSSRLAPGDMLDMPRFSQRLLEMAKSSSAEAPKDDEDAKLTPVLADRVLAQLSSESRAAVEQLGDRRRSSATEPERKHLVDDLNSLIGNRDAFPKLDISEKSALYIALESEAKRLYARDRTQLNQDEVERYNRLVLEAAFPGAIRKVYGGGWRPLMFIYGGIGLIVAAMYWLLTRDRPEQHPRVNRMELSVIASGLPPGATKASGKVRGVPIVGLLLSFSMWMMCLSQFFTNIGWVFLVTWAPRYFQAVHHIPVETRALMTAIPALVGWAGMVGGGWLTDWMARRFGLRWGRALPLALTRFLAMTAYVYCLTNPSPWSVVVAFSVVAFATDLGTASSWAYMQDVGGQYVGSVLGWANMCGNLGAAVAPIFVARVVDIDGTANWNAAFMTCAVAFLLSGLCGLFVNATIPIVREEPEDDLLVDNARPEADGGVDGNV